MCTKRRGESLRIALALLSIAAFCLVAPRWNAAAARSDRYTAPSPPQARAHAGSAPVPVQSVGSGTAASQADPSAPGLDLPDLSQRVSDLEKQVYAARVVVAALLALGAAIFGLVIWAGKALLNQHAEKIRADVTGDVQLAVAAAVKAAEEAKAAIQLLWGQNEPLLEEVKTLVAAGEDLSQAASGDPHALYRLADREWSEGRRARAVGLLARILDVPTGEGSWILLHNAYILARQLEDTTLATRIAQKAYEDYPGVTRCALHYARQLSISGRIADARKIYEQLLAESKDEEEEVARQYIDFLRMARLFDEAEEFFDQRRASLGASAGIRAELGDLRRTKGDITGAEDEFRAAIELDRTNDLPLGYLAHLLYELGKLDEAETTVRHAIRVSGEQSPRRGEHFLLLGHILREKENANAAKAAYSAALIFDPGAIEAARWLRAMVEFEGSS